MHVSFLVVNNQRKIRIFFMLKLYYDASTCMIDRCFLCVYIVTILAVEAGKFRLILDCLFSKSQASMAQRICALTHGH